MTTILLLFGLLMYLIQEEFEEGLILMMLSVIFVLGLIVVIPYSFYKSL